MTESVHAVKPRAGAQRAPSDADSEPAVPSCQVPVAGLVFGASLDGPGQLGGPIARPGSVVEALRRQSIRGQTIRRSSGGVVMNLEDESTSDDPERTIEEPAAWAGNANQAGQNIVGWLRREAKKAANYTVAVWDDDIYISKVNGVTSKTRLMQRLKKHIEDNGINQVCAVYLCKKFSKDLPSNHAEMCVAAAIGEDNLPQTSFLECTAASCDYCRVFLAHYNAPNSSPASDAASQEGWIHPFQRLAWGTQLGGAHDAHVRDLADHLKHPATKPKLGMDVGPAPQADYEKWL
jgi:hypothetical protein